jgi:hypothetical protein
MTPGRPPEGRAGPGALGYPDFRGFDPIVVGMNGAGGCVAVARTACPPLKLAGLTVEAWVRPEPRPRAESQTLWSLPMQEHPRYLRLRLLPQGVWELGSERVWTRASGARPGRWQHLAGVCRREGIVLYLDGVKAASARITTRPVAQGDALLGASPKGDGYTDGFRGQLAKMRIWSRALEPDQLRLAMAGRLPPDWGQLAHWPLDEGLGLVSRNRAPDALREPPATPFGAARFHCVGGWPDYVIARIG